MSQHAPVACARAGHRVLCYAASVGHSVWFSEDLGEHWLRAPTPNGGIYNESRCWCLAVHEARPDEVWSGTDQGLYVWRHSLGRWTYLPSPLDGLHILKIARSPLDPDFVVIGTRPAEVFVTRDGGANWRQSELPIDDECWFINTPRVTSIQFDRRAAETIWVTVEIAGIFRSDDGGASWQRCNDGLLDVDVHNLAIIDAEGARRILASTEVGLHVSEDDGRSWAFTDVPLAGAHKYFRCLAQHADDASVVFLSVGDRPSGTVGRLLSSRDGGRSWREVSLPGPVNTTIWWVYTSPQDPQLILANSIFGEFFRSEDGGASWVRAARVLGEVREVAFQRLPYQDAAAG